MLSTLVNQNHACARSFQLASTKEVACHARGIVREWLGSPHPALFEAQLVISELVTNAYRYGPEGSPITICMPYIEAGSCKVTVIDGGNRDCAPRMHFKRDPAIEGQQGLNIVNNYSREDWGTYTLVEGGPRVVWAWIFATTGPFGTPDN